jgi:hypothetical protein
LRVWHKSYLLTWSYSGFDIYLRNLDLDLSMTKEVWIPLPHHS